MKRFSRGLLRSLSVAFAALPLAFAVIRAVQTGGRDLRYIVVALAALIGAAAVHVAAGRHGRKPMIAALSVAVFMGSTLVAVIAALLIGTILGPGTLVVASAFGFCLAAACLLHVVAAD